MRIGERWRGRRGGTRGLARSRRPRLWLAAFGASVAALVALFYIALAGLSLAGRLPPPPLTGTACIDAKLAWLREDPQRLEAGVVAVGSSVTWRNLDFSALSAAERAALGGVVNAAPCFLFANQTRFLADVITRIRPSVHTILTVIAPRDFESCSEVPAAFAEERLLERYLDGRTAPAWVQFRNFRPYQFLRTAYRLPEWRADVLRFDAFGSGPLEPEEPVMWGPVSIEPDCFSELTAMAHELGQRDVRLVVVLFPTMPSWVELHGLEPLFAAFEEAARDALAGTDAVLIDAIAGHPAEDDAFADPVHWSWPAAAGFTRWLFDEMRRADLQAILHRGASARRRRAAGRPRIGITSEAARSNRPSPRRHARMPGSGRRVPPHW